LSHRIRRFGAADQRARRFERTPERAVPGGERHSLAHRIKRPPFLAVGASACGRSLWNQGVDWPQATVRQGFLRSQTRSCGRSHPMPAPSRCRLPLLGTAVESRRSILGRSRACVGGLSQGAGTDAPGRRCVSGRSAGVDVGDHGHFLRFGRSFIVRNITVPYGPAGGPAELARSCSHNLRAIDCTPPRSRR